MTIDIGSGPDVLRLDFVSDGDERINGGVLVNGAYVGHNDFDWALVDSTNPASPTTIRLHGDWTSADGDDAFFFRNITGGHLELVDASINGVAVEGGKFDASHANAFGPVFFNGDAVAPAPDPQPEPEPEPEPPPPSEPGKTIGGTASADTLLGSNGPDTISGLGGDDSLLGAGGDDILRGGAGSDFLNGGVGDDLITTNSGRDVISYVVGQGKDTVTDFASGFDTLLISGGDDASAENTTRDGVAGVLVTFAEHPDSEVWLPGASDLHLLTALS